MAMFSRDILKDHVGAFRTVSLFVGYNTSNLEPILTLAEEDQVVDGVVYPSLQKIYLSYNDPTEYQFAIDVFGSWRAWKRISGSAKIAEHVNRWREEAEIRMRSEAIRALHEVATNEGPRGVGAAKYVAERGWEKRAGRPSNEEVERQKRIHAGISKALDEDAERIGIH